jgi:hypothetical protein
MSKIKLDIKVGIGPPKRISNKEKYYDSEEDRAKKYSKKDLIGFAKFFHKEVKEGIERYIVDRAKDYFLNKKPCRSPVYDSVELYSFARYSHFTFNYEISFINWKLKGCWDQ